MTQIEQRDPKTLTPAPEIAEFPRWPQDSREFLGFCNDIREGGIRHPLQITADGVVLDGETRRLGAVAIGLQTVPCQVIPDTEAYGVIVRELVQRRNMTKSAKAFWSYPIFRDLHAEAIERAKANLKKGQVSRLQFSGGRENIGDFVESLGICRELFRQAARVHEIFEADPEYRAKTLPEINEHGIRLGGVIAGHAGRETTRGNPRQDAPEGIRFSSTFRSLAIRCSKCDLPTLRKSVAEVVRAVPEDQLDSLHHLADELRVQVRTRLRSNT